MSGLTLEFGDPLQTVSSLRSTVSCWTPPQTIAPTEPEPSGSASSQTLAGESYFSSYAADAVSASTAVRKAEPIMRIWSVVFMPPFYHIAPPQDITQMSDGSIGRRPPHVAPAVAVVLWLESLNARSRSMPLRRP